MEPVRRAQYQVYPTGIQKSQVVGPRRGPWILNYLSYDRQGMNETGVRMRWRGRTMAMNPFLVAVRSQVSCNLIGIWGLNA